jgi:hypothetical protein
MEKILCFLLIALLAGCVTTTNFMGKAKIEGGVSECEAKCKKWGMELVGMVALGEYTDGCICKKKEPQLSMQDVGESVILSSAGSGGGVAAVIEAQSKSGAPLFVPGGIPSGLVRTIRKAVINSKVAGQRWLLTSANCSLHACHFLL